MGFFTPKNKSRRRKKNSNMVPVLFTIGIIGWGFFVIDRLTVSLIKEDIMLGNPKFHSLSNKKTKESWKQKFKVWLFDLVEETEENKSRNAVKESSDLPILKEEILNIKKKKEEKKTVKIYFYKVLPNQSPKLASLKRDINLYEDSLKKTLEILIGGPSKSEKKQSFIDSFVKKPKILNVTRKEKTLVINFKDSFGEGVGFQVIRYQLKQLLKTAKQFPGIDSIQLQINGKFTNFLGSEGLALPKIISEETLVL